MAPSSRNGTFSPPLTSTSSFTSIGQAKLNVVSRLAIEGKAKRGADGASIKIYLKITVPVDSVSPGQIIPLFAEENVKIRDYQVHPLDAESVPYNFSSTTNPLLHNAARALSLPARSTKSYLSLFESATQMASGRASSPNGSVVPPLEERYTGYFLISGYNVCFVLPKEFPPKYKIKGGSTDSDGDGLPSKSMYRTPTPYKGGRRSSIAERNTIQFMTALILWVPFSSKPPKAPFMLSIPIPRCLSNTIKVQLPPPTTISQSFASLSSDDDTGGWDLATEPHVIRSSQKAGSRISAYNEFADDESSESSIAGSAETCLIQGTFTSTDNIRIRWASPSNLQEFPDPGDGRRRVRVSEVRGNVTCTILEKVPDGIKMRIDYQGDCAGVWFPGVATLLGLDVKLDAQGCRVSWPNEIDGNWSVDGDAALMGFNIGLPQRESTLSHQPSLEIPRLPIRMSSDALGEIGSETITGRPSRSSSGSSASLLRAPLPQQLTHEYSFEDTLTPTTSGIPSSVPSLSTSMTQSSFASGALEHGLSPPSAAISIHINMNELISSTKNKFTFNVSGTVIISKVVGMNNSSDLDNPTIPLPVFRVFEAEAETISTTVRNQCDGANVEVVGSDSSLTKGASKKSVIPSGSQVKCNTEGSEILIKPLLSSIRPPVKIEEQTVSLVRHTSPVALSQPSSPESMIALNRSRQLAQSAHFIGLRDGPLMIPWVLVDVVPIASAPQKWSYAVTLSMPTPVEVSSDWLEFGIAFPQGHRMLALVASGTPEVNLTSASVNGVPVRFETFEQLNEDSEKLSPGSSVEASGRRKWLRWVRVHVALAGALEIVYLVKNRASEARPDTRGKRKESQRNSAEVDVLLPMFSLPVGRYEVTVRPSSDYSSGIVLPDEMDHGISRKVLHFDLQPFSYCNVTMQHPSLVLPEKGQRIYRIPHHTGPTLIAALSLIASALLLNHVIGMRSELRDLKSLAYFERGISTDNGISQEMKIPTVTVSTCIPLSSSAATSERKWFGDTTSISSLPSHTRKPESPPKVHQQLKVSSASNSTPLPADTSTLRPIIYIPLSWPLHFKTEYEQIKSQFSIGWERVMQMVEVLMHWPLPP